MGIAYKCFASFQALQATVVVVSFCLRAEKSILNTCFFWHLIQFADVRVPTGTILSV